MRDHARYAILQHSGDIPKITVFGHSGWRSGRNRKTGLRQSFYLHAGGAIGEQGAIAGIKTELPDGLKRMQLELPQALRSCDAPFAPALILSNLGRIA